MPFRVVPIVADVDEAIGAGVTVVVVNLLAALVVGVNVRDVISASVKIALDDFTLLFVVTANKLGLAVV